MIARLSLFVFVLSACANSACADSEFAQRVARVAALPEGYVITDSAVGPRGALYVAGRIGFEDAFLAKFGAQGGDPKYLHVFAGDGIDQATALAVDGAGAAYVAVLTASGNLRGTPGALQPTRRSDGGQAFVAKFSPEGELVYQTYLGGAADTYAGRILLTPAGEAVVSGSTREPGFPVTDGVAFTSDAFQADYVLKLDSSGSQLVFALRGLGGDAAALDSQGNIYVAGLEGGPLFIPVTPGAFQTTHPVVGCAGSGFVGIVCRYAYVAKLNPEASEILYATYLTGTQGSRVADLEVDGEGRLLAAGTTPSLDFPTTPGALLREHRATAPRPPSWGIRPTIHPPPTVGFVSQLNADGSALDFSTYFSGTFEDEVTGVRRTSDAIELRGYAGSADLPGLSAPSGCLPYPFLAEIALDGGSALNAQLLDAAPGDAGAAVPGALDGKALANVGGEILAVDWDAAPARVGCVLDSASSERVRGLSPGALVSIFGRELAADTTVGAPGANGLLPDAAGDLSVLVNDRPAPLLYASPGQINFQVPLEVGRDVPAEILWRRDTDSESVGSFDVVDQRPAVFLSSLQETACAELQASASGAASPLALNADGTVNSCANPAKKGTRVRLFLTGLGRVLAEQQTGARFGPEAVPLGVEVELGADTAAQAVALSSHPGSIANVFQLDVQLDAFEYRAVVLAPTVDDVAVGPERVVIWVAL